MPATAAYIDTPYYVVMHGKQRLGPDIAPLPSGAGCEAIYAFSDKDCYDRFCANSQLALTPYPLTKFYLRNRADASVDRLNLVVVDATGLPESCLRAGTMEAVLQGQEDRTSHVTAAYHLTFDPEAAAYRVTVNANLKTGKGRMSSCSQRLEHIMTATTGLTAPPPDSGGK